MTQTSASSRMSRGSVARLLIQFSLPATLGMVASALYNIVDRLFIGRFTGADGLAAVGLTFPLTVFVIAAGSLVGVGAASQISRFLGEGRTRAAERALGNALAVMTVFSVLFTLLALLRRAWRNRSEPVPPPGEAEESQPVRAAALAVVGVCGWMALFGALAGAARSLAGPAADALLCLMDVPSGAGTVCALPLPGEARLVLLAALCGSGGGCVGMQNLSALKGCGMRPAEYFAARLLAAALCAGFTALQLRLGDLPPLPRWRVRCWSK